MTIDRIHQEFKLRWNKLNTNHKKNFPTSYLDDIFNKVSDDFVEIFYTGNNSKLYKFGFEVTQARMDMLQTLIVPETNYAVSTISDTKYTLDLGLLDDYKHFLRASVYPVECSDKRIPVTIVRINDLDKKLTDSNTQPSLNWNRCLGSIKNNTIELYTKDYTISEVFVEYLKAPVKVFFGGYDTLEYEKGDLSAYQSGSPKVTSDIPEQYHDLLVDMAVQYVASILEDTNKYQLQEKQILNKV